MRNLPTSFAVPESEFTADVAAVCGTDFCSLWLAGRPALAALQGVVSSSLVNFAITTVLSAGDAYCGSKKPSKAQVLERLQAAGISSLDDLAHNIVNKLPEGDLPMTVVINPTFLIMRD